jgi:hypothetical protein
MSPTSAIRTSFDRGFRIRSRSEVDKQLRPELIQEARRKFFEKEQAKEEKAAREEIRAMEKRNQKEARQIEKSHRRSSASDGTRNKRSKSDLTLHDSDVLTGRNFSRVPMEGTAPVGQGGEEFEEPIPRSNTGFGSTKLKTHGMWTKFVMWFRTRLLRLGGKKK